MNRAERRALQFSGRGRTKPPIPHVKSHLSGAFSCAARQAFLAFAIQGHPGSAQKVAAYLHQWAAPCSPRQHPGW